MQHARDNGDAKTDLWAIFPGYGSHRVQVRRWEVHGKKTAGMGVPLPLPSAGVITGSSLSSADRGGVYLLTERMGGGSDNEFDVEKDNERAGVRIENISSPKLQTRSEVRDQRTRG